MALTVREYYDLIITEKQTFSSLVALQPNIDSSQQLLQDLSSTSRVAEWRLDLWIMAFVAFLIITACERLAAETESGTPAWYRRKALEFQYGDQLDTVNNRPQYPTVNAQNRIIKLAAIVEAVDGRIFVKVSKLQAGNPVPLTAPEKTAFTEYTQRIKFAGTRITVVSQPADDLFIGYRVFVDSLQINTSGVRISDGTRPVDDAINVFLAAMPYDGILHMDSLTDAIQRVDGVTHVVLLFAQAKPWYESAANYEDITADTAQKYNPEAGYLRVSTATNETLIDTIEYLPAV